MEADGESSAPSWARSLHTSTTGAAGFLKQPVHSESASLGQGKERADCRSLTAPFPLLFLPSLPGGGGGQAWDPRPGIPVKGLLCSPQLQNGGHG